MDGGSIIKGLAVSALMILIVLCTPALGQISPNQGYLGYLDTQDPWWLEAADFLGPYPGITPVIEGAIKLNPQPYPGTTSSINNANNLNPQSPEAWNNKGVVLNHLGKQEEAIQAFDKAIEINPQLAQLWGNKGDSLKGLLRYDEALQAYDKAIELNPQWAGPWIGKSLVLNNQKNAEGAKQAAERAIELDPQNALAWYAQGDSLLNLGMYYEAVQSYDRAIDLGKQNHQNIVPDAREHKGIALQRLDRITEANDVFSTVKEPVPYTDDLMKFTIQMPNGWAIGKATTNNRTFTIFLNPIPEKDPQGNIIFNENIHVAYDYLIQLIGRNITKVSLDDYFAKSKTVLAKSLQAYHLIYEREVAIGNTKGEIIEQTFTQNGLQLRSMQLFVKDGVIAYVITGVDLASKWDIDKDLIEASLMSFRPSIASANQSGTKTFGGSGRDEGHAVQQTTDGGYIITGATKSFGLAKQSPWLIKTDANGEEMWNKTFGDLGDEDDWGNSVQQTTDGGYIITGRKQIPSNGTKRISELWLIKTDSIGNRLWDKTLAGEGSSVQQTADGGYIITGSATLSDSTKKVIVNLIKTDANGNMLWYKRLDCLDGTSVQQTIDGGYIIAGDQSSAPPYKTGIRLIKTDANGNEIWSKTFGEDGNWSGSVQQTADGGYVITGTHGSGKLKKNLWLIKTDPNGNKLWDRIFYDSNVMICSSGQKTSDGGYIITGTKEIGDLVAAYSGGISDIWLIKTDANGNMLWNKTFEGSNGFGGQAVQQTSDGGYVITGATKPLEGKSSDVLLIRTDASGELANTPSPGHGISIPTIKTEIKPSETKSIQNMSEFKPRPAATGTSVPIPTTNASAESYVRSFIGSGNDKAESVQQTSDGGYIIAGKTNSYSSNDDALLTKTDPYGAELWNKTFGGSGNDEAYSVRQTSDGGYIIAGSTNSSGAGHDVAWLIRTDASGNKQWDREFSGANNSEGYSAQQTKDGGYIFSGSTDSGHAWLIKTDSSGNWEWDKTFNNRCTKSTVQQTTDGGYIISIEGTQTLLFRLNNVDNNGGLLLLLLFIPGGPSWLIKTDSYGNELWNKTIGRTGDWITSMQQTSDGGYIIGGSITILNPPHNHTAAWLVKTDTNGNTLWDKTFGGSKNDSSTYVRQTIDGGYIIAGSTTSFGSGGQDVWLIKTDANGNRLWDKTFGGAENDCATSVQQTKDGGYIIAGYTQFCNQSGGGIWLIKTDAKGNVGQSSSGCFEPPNESSTTLVFHGSIGRKDLQEKFVNVPNDIKRLSVNCLDESRKGDVAFVLLDPEDKRAYAVVGSESAGSPNVIRPTSGRWRIWVYGNNVPMGQNESFSFIVTQYFMKKGSDV